jgi:hypothetical protein
MPRLSRMALVLLLAANLATTAVLAAPGPATQPRRSVIPASATMDLVSQGMRKSLPFFGLTPRGYLNYRQLTRSYLTPTYKIPVLQFGEEEVRALLSQVTRRAPQAVRHAKNVLSCAFA